MTHLRLGPSAFFALLSTFVLPACDDENEETVHTFNGLGDPALDAAHVSTCPTVDAERNDTLTMAVDLPGLVGCSDSTKGVIAGGNDVDYFRFFGNGASACTDVPHVHVEGDGIRVCIFPVCSDGATEIGGCGDGDAVYIDSGPEGCCSDGSGNAGPVTFACSDPPSTASSPVYLRVDIPLADDQCHPYKLAYTY